jgi:hypothetical protein
MSGRVCEKHQEYCPDGECRWCEPEPAAGLLGIAADAVKLTGIDPPAWPLWSFADPPGGVLLNRAAFKDLLEKYSSIRWSTDE